MSRAQSGSATPSSLLSPTSSSSSVSNTPQSQITLQLLKNISSTYDLEIVHKLNLSSRGISNLPTTILSCMNLTSLDLSFNSLTSVKMLRGLQHLTSLTMVYNSISSLESFEELIQLEQLHIQGNDITAMSEIEHLVVLPKLKVLSLQNVDGSDPNPVCVKDPANYIKYITAALPSLAVLDARRLANADGTAFYSAVMKKYEKENTQPRKPIVPYDWSKDIELITHDPLLSSNTKSLPITTFKNYLFDCKKLLEDASALIESQCTKIAQPTL